MFLYSNKCESPVAALKVKFYLIKNEEFEYRVAIKIECGKQIGGSVPSAVIVFAWGGYDRLCTLAWLTTSSRRATDSWGSSVLVLPARG